MTSCSNCGYTSEEEWRFCPQCGTKAASGTETEGLLGKTFAGKYRIQAEIGQGSMGRVFQAEHSGLKKKVALKVLHKELDVGEEALKRFQREGIAAGKFSHPNAIQIFDFDRHEDSWFLAMEFVEGENLKAMLARRAPLEPKLAIELVQQILRPLAEAHAQGIVHRDLKPENIMATPDASGGYSIKVLDFGLSKLVDRPSLESSLQTQPGRILGTPLYMAPEQWGGEEVDPRTDIYTVGLILYEMLAGKPPFKGSNFTETMVKSTTESAPPIGDLDPGLGVPSDLDEVLQKALEKKREDRYQSATQMLLDLDDVRWDHQGTVRSRSKSGTRGKAGTRSEGKGSKSPMPALLGVGLLAAVAAGAFWFLGGDGAADGVRLSQRDPATLSREQGDYVRSLQQSRNLIRNGRFERAIGALDRWRASELRDAELPLVRGLAFARQDDPEIARQEFAEALRQDPRFVEPMVELAWIDLAEGALDAAETQLEQARAMSPDDPKVQTLAGALTLLSGDPATAATTLQPLVESGQASARTYRILGQALLQQGDTGGAAEAFTELRRIEPNAAAGHEGSAQVRILEGDYRGARLQFERALELDGDSRTAFEGLATVLVEMQQWDDAERVIEDGLSNHPDAVSMLTMKGLVLQAQGAKREAIRTLSRVRKQLEGEAARSVGRQLASLYLRQFNPGDAATILEELLSEDPEDGRCHLYLGLARMQQRRYPEAGAALAEAVQRLPEDAGARLNYGIWLMDYAAEADDASARAEFEAYLSLGGDDPRVRGWLNELR